MKKIYILTAVFALLTLSLNAQDGELKKATHMRLQTSSKTVTDPKAQRPPTVSQLVSGIKGMSSVLQATQGPNGKANSRANRAPLKLNAGEELMGPFTTYDTSISGYTSYGWSTAYGSNYQQIYIFADLDRSAFEGHDGEDIVGYRFALAGNTSQTAVLYDFMAWPYSSNGYFESANQHTWRISEAAGAQPMTSFDDIVITVPSYYTQFHSITVYGDNNTVLTSWTADGNTVSDGTNEYYEMPTGWTLSQVYMFPMTISGTYYGYLSTDSQGSITISSSLLSGNNSVRVEINAVSYTGSMTVDVNGDTRNLTTTASTNTWTLSPSGTTTPVYQELQAGQWYEYYLDEPIPFSVADSIAGMYLGYRFFQYPSTQTSELLNPVAINPNSNTAGIVTNRYGQSGTTNAIGDITITIPSTYTNIRSITVTSGNTTITSYSYANNGGTLPSGWDFGGSINIRSDYGGEYSLCSQDGSGYLTLSSSLFQNYTNVTVSIYFSTSTRNQTASVGVNGTTKTTTNRTGTTQTWTVNATSVPAYRGGWWDENINGDLAVQLIFKSKKTAAPAITYVVNDGNVVITATGDGTVTLTVGDQTATGNGTASVTVPRTDVNYDVTATATAQETGKEESDPTTQVVTIPYMETAAPVITYTVNGDNVVITATGDGTVTLTVDGQTATGNGTASVTLPRTSSTYNVTATATAQETGKHISETTTEQITIPFLQTAAPTITYTVDGDNVIITATGDGTVTLTVGGQTESGTGSASITIPIGVVATTVTATATAQESGKAASETTTLDVPIPAGEGWLPMDGTYNNPTDLLNFKLDGQNVPIMLLDQFLASTLDNSHPSSYDYVMKEIVHDVEMSSNTVTIPVYKTSSTMQGLYTKAQVDDDIDMHLTANALNSEMDYDVHPDRNALYYSLYRGDLNAAYPTIDARHRVSQLQKYEEMVNNNVHYFFTETHTSNILPVYQEQIEEQTVERLDVNYVQGVYNNELSYVPVIWTFGLYTARGDGKNNSYGSDIKREKLGNVTVKIRGSKSGGNNVEDTNAGWEGLFKVGNEWYCIYTPIIDIDGIVPNDKTHNDGDVATYVPYMYRAWCLYPGARSFKHVAQTNSQGQTVQVLADDGELTIPYLLGTNQVEASHTQIGQAWQNGQPKLQWAFGVPVSEDPANVPIAVRFYYKKNVTNASPSTLRAGKRADGEVDENSEEYYIVQVEGTADELVTSINEFYAGKAITSVTYVNAQGMKSDKPFDGLNIVVTRYSDGTTSTSKVMR